MPLFFAEHVELVDIFRPRYIALLHYSFVYIEKNVREAVGKAHINEL